MEQASHDRVERRGIVAALGYDEMGVTPARRDVGLVHRSHAEAVLSVDGREVPPSLIHVAANAAEEPDVVVRVDEEAKVEEVAHLRDGIEKQSPRR